MVFFGRRREARRSGRNARVRFGRWTWIGDGTKIRCHEGQVRIGAKTVMGQECTISAYQHVSIGEQCIVADRVMLIDFDHNVAEVERPIRVQGIYKRDVRVGSNVWIGYGAQILRGVTVGDNAIIGASAVVTRDVPANAVVAGAPARVIRMRETPGDAALAGAGRAGHAGRRSGRLVRRNPSRRSAAGGPPRAARPRSRAASEISVVSSCGPPDELDRQRQTRPG